MFGGCSSCFIADGFAPRDAPQYHEEPRGKDSLPGLASPLFPLDGFGSSVPSFQLHPVFGGISKRVPPNDAPSRFIGFGDKSWDNFKNFFETQ